MKKYKYVFLPYYLNKHINYIYVLSLLSVAVDGITDNGDINSFQLKNDVEFYTYEELAKRINTKLSNYRIKQPNGELKEIITANIISNIVKDSAYKPLFDYVREKRVGYILLNTDFQHFDSKKLPKDSKYNSFVRLSPAMVRLILAQQDKMLALYIIYLVHQCQIKQNDFTAKQFLNACGYSTKSNEALSKISSFNRLLEKMKIVEIESWFDELKQKRNRYKLIDY